MASKTKGARSEERGEGVWPRSATEGNRRPDGTQAASYIIDGRELFVSAGLDDKYFMTMFRKPNGARKRVKSPRLPLRTTFDEAQRDLDNYVSTLRRPKKK